LPGERRPQRQRHLSVDACRPTWTTSSTAHRRT
jgi:hypothetical protein